jgi:tRNA nucleotidyltransferase (CCA-adding enzyme)
MPWEHFRHGADVGVRGLGVSRADALEQIALALTAVVADPLRVREETLVELRCDAGDDELLVIDWLNALIFEMSTRNLLFGRFAVTLYDHVLDAKAWGESVDCERHQPLVEVKAATYAELSMGRREDGIWIAQCVVDV